MDARTLIVFATPVATGVAIGRLRGGRLSQLSAIRLERLWLLWLAAALHALQMTPSTWPVSHGPARLPVLAATYAAALTWLARNTVHRPHRQQSSIATAATGATLNAVAITVNGRMPYSRSAAAAAGLGPGGTTAENLAATAHTRLLVLGDIIPVPRLHIVLSIGDLAVIAGVAALISTAMQHTAIQDTVTPKESSPCASTSP